ncbi:MULTISPECIES: hypothetical protein [unclassified Streptosporangium]|uniref:hypothetical protein n=1 Tax=unclassified Streptosporangium TaxID=2632669 RepID=UPI002E2D067C|nr:MULTISPECIES: hypothetical protein [unclassified Streptosporangium]
MRHSGRILRFDGISGYGSIVSDDDEEIRLHAADLRDDKYLFVPGTEVSFEIEESGHGLKAYDVALAGSTGGPVLYVLSSRREEAEEDLCDVLPRSEFLREITEVIVVAVPSLSARQILQLRAHLARFALSHHWIEG